MATGVTVTTVVDGSGAGSVGGAALAAADHSAPISIPRTIDGACLTPPRY
jgi:hypothetical protein